MATSRVTRSHPDLVFAAAAAATVAAAAVVGIAVMAFLVAGTLAVAAASLYAAAFARLAGPSDLAPLPELRVPSGTAKILEFRR